MFQQSKKGNFDMNLLIRYAPILAVGSLVLFSGKALSAEEVIYDRESNNTLRSFVQFLEDPSQTPGRPSIGLGSEGLIGRPGDGNFTAHKFADLVSDSWTLKIQLQIPPGARYSNSGIYLLYSDPNTDIPANNDPTRSAFDEALQRSQDRRERFGAGPFELDFFSHELQIIAGTDATVPPENRGTAAFYGVDIGIAPGQQVISSPYFFNIGGRYELVIVQEGLETKTFARAIGFQSDPVLVSTFTNLGKVEDPVRGGAPKALLLQAFYNNGSDVRSPYIRRMTLDQR
jgi:hypothetical protein